MNVHTYKAAAAKAAVSFALSGAGLLLFATPAFAGVGGSVVPDYPSPVTVGQTALPATLTITNQSTAANATESISVSTITHTPSCGTTLNSTCQTADADTGVFTVHNGTGHAATACAGIAFTAGAPDSNGNIIFTPGSAVTLGPSSGTLASSTCIIDFTVDVLKVPTKDANAIAVGVQTDELGSAQFAGQTSGLTGSGAGSTQTTVNKVSPTIATTPSAGGPVGTVLNDTASLSGGSSPTGSVTFRLFSPSDSTCAAAPAYTNTDPSAPYATSPGFTSNASGVWHWTAVYAGDTNNNPATSTCASEPVTVTKVTPTITTTLSTTTAVLTGTAVHDSATLSGATSSPSGTATYTVYTNNTCSAGAQSAGTKTVTAGVVPDSDPITFNTAGTFYWQVVYSGDANNAAATSTCGSEVLVVQAPPPPPAGQYCSPGFWKQSQHFHDWVTFTPSQTFSSVFGRTITIQWSDGGKPTSVTNPTLLQALQANGGGISMLARVAVDALLNASALSSGFTTAQVISIIQHAIDTGNFDAAATQLTAPENCPLS
jgi:hypothetical protein